VDKIKAALTLLEELRAASSHNRSHEVAITVLTPAIAKRVLSALARLTGYYQPKVSMSKGESIFYFESASCLGSLFSFDSDQKSNLQRQRIDHAGFESSGHVCKHNFQRC
jgi:hypothetical protein